MNAETKSSEQAYNDRIEALGNKYGQPQLNPRTGEMQQMLVWGGNASFPWIMITNVGETVSVMFAGYDNEEFSIEVRPKDFPAFMAEALVVLGDQPAKENA